MSLAQRNRVPGGWIARYALGLASLLFIPAATVAVCLAALQRAGGLGPWSGTWVRGGSLAVLLGSFVGMLLLIGPRVRAPSYALPLTKAQWALELLGRSLGLVGWYAVGVLLVADASFGLSVLARVVCMALFANCTFLGVSILASLVAALHRQVPLRRSALWTWGVVPVGVVFSTVLRGGAWAGGGRGGRDGRGRLTPADGRGYDARRRPS